MLCPLAVHAGASDVPFVSRFSDRDSLFVIVALDLLFIAVNYLFNFFFIGYPAMVLGKIAFDAMAWDILLITLGVQCADRAGAVIIGMLVGPALANSMNGYWGDWITAGYYFSLNFMFSGLAIGALILFFGTRRWGLSMKARWGLALLAVIFTNPAYAMLFETWHQGYLFALCGQ